jgi:hypothetical protein
MSFQSVKFFGRPLLLLSAALLVQSGSVAAAGSSADVHEQIKGVLAGTVTQSSQPSERRNARVVGRGDELQESIRRLLQGATDASTRDSKVTAHFESAAPRGYRPSHENGPTMAQRVLLGQRTAPSGG